MTSSDDVHHRAVRWLSPEELFRTGLRAALAGAIGQFTDNRESQQGPAFEQWVFDEGQGRTELWLDYVSDTGDGYDATYSVASLLGTDSLKVGRPGEPDTPAHVLPRGDVLVMGGDQVYPTADAKTYEERTTKVFAMASPADPPDPPSLYAVPGNHDWYDGLTAFLRVFCQEGLIGSWRTRQARSYFALRLPSKWWLLGIDIQLDTYIDKPQLDYFRRICEEEIKEDASIIICTAKPSWYRANADPDATDRLLHFLRYSLGGKGRNVRLLLTGDSHHYARYRSPDGDQHLVTAGHGGAYASATHLMEPCLQLSARLRDPEQPKTVRSPYTQGPARWPSEEDSRRAAAGVLWRLVTRNPSLFLVFSALYGVLLAAVVQASWVWTVVLGALVVGGCIAFAKPADGNRRTRLVHGGILAVAECVPLVVAGVLFARARGDLPIWALLGAGLGVALLGGLLAAEVLAVWLWAVARWRVNTNELFAAQSIEDFKGFLRMHIGADGVLTVFPVGLRRVVHDWADDGSGRRVPKKPGALRPELIEPEFTIRPVAAPTPEPAAWTT